MKKPFYVLIFFILPVVSEASGPDFNYISQENVLNVTESHSVGENNSAIEIVNGSCMNYTNWTHELRSNGAGMWLADISGQSQASPVPDISSDDFSAWVCLEFDRVYSLGMMWVWNLNQWPIMADRCIRDVWIDYSQDGVVWSRLMNGTKDYFTLNQSPSNGPLEHTDEIDFNGADAKYICITAKSFPDGTYGSSTYCGLSEILVGTAPVGIDEFLELNQVYPETLNLPEYSNCLAVYDSEIRYSETEVICRHLYYNVSGLGNDANESISILARCADTKEKLLKTSFTPVFTGDPFPAVDRRGKYFQLRIYVFGENPDDPPRVTNVKWRTYEPDNTAVNPDSPQPASPQIRGPEISFNPGFEAGSTFSAMPQGWTPIQDISSSASSSVQRISDLTAPEGGYSLKIEVQADSPYDVFQAGAYRSFKMNGENAAVVSFWIKGEDISGIANAYSGARVNYHVTGTDGVTVDLLDGFYQGYGTDWYGTTKNFDWIKITNFVNPGKPIDKIVIMPCLYRIANGTVWFDDLRVEPVLDYGNDDGGAALYASNDGRYPISIHLLPQHDNGPQSYIPMLAESGFNMTVWRTGYLNTFGIEMLDYLNQYGMKDIARAQDGIENLSNLTTVFDRHPACWGYQLKDEPGGSRHMPYDKAEMHEIYNYIRNKGCNKPCTVVANDEHTALNFVDYVDYYGGDIYRGPDEIALRVLDQKSICGPMSSFLILQSYWDYYVDNFSNPDGLKAAAFAAVINGTRGIGGFRFRGPGFENYLKAVERVYYVANALVDGWDADIVIDSTQGGIMARGLWYDRNADGNAELYLIAAEIENASASASIIIDGLNSEMFCSSVFGEADYYTNDDTLSISLPAFGTDVIRFVSRDDASLDYYNQAPLSQKLPSFVNYWLYDCRQPLWCDFMDYDRNGIVDFLDFSDNFHIY
jgi:hypothetical protein